MKAERLTGLDTSFLHMERAGAHMHVASVSVFEGPAPAHSEFRDHIGSRLHLVPRFRQKLRFVPFDQGRPVWVDDPHLNLEYHVRQTALPAPGSDEQLRNLAARIFSQQLDRSKPLWELWLVEGLEGGRFAIVGKSHHALVDGVSGVDITTVLFDLDAEPQGAASAAPPWLARPEPTDLELLGEAWRERLTSPKEIVRGVRAAFRGPRQVLRGVGATSKMIGAGMAAPSSVFNVEIGPHRRFAMAQADLADLKRVKDAHGGTVNDVILSIVAGTLGKYLRARGHDTEGLELRAMVPVSIRAEEEHGALGNRISAMMAALPVWSEDPVERLQIVSAEMGDLKTSGQAVGAEILTKLTDFAPGTIASQAARLQPAQRFFNLVVTNVPGPQFPLYVLGRKMESIFPMVPLARRQALCVGIMSYNGQVNFGLIGDYDAMPDLESFALDLEATAAEALATVPAKPKRSRAKASASANGSRAVASEPRS
ncbi:MAG TPA: wax ester/triacylglycerol synthase family O-acyltransferase [Solirubrobacterales bacterium]|jgi:WS/DGAT/MGAT family acyltransferase|nr:wax ester/triacylglycerol synthase family O-acyltransferase [Solirubrobacterales bacterium]